MKTIGEIMLFVFVHTEIEPVNTGCYCIEQQQLVEDIERLTSDKADLRTRLQCYEEDLKTANECENCVIIMILCEDRYEHFQWDWIRATTKIKPSYLCSKKNYIAYNYVVTSTET